MTKKCQGCGTILQNTFPQKEGYVDDLNKELCERCFKLKNYGEYRKVSLGNEDYKEILGSIPQTSLVVYLTSALSLNLNYIKNFSNVIIVITKKDLLPKSVKDYKLVNYVSKITSHYLDIEVISALKNYNLDSLLAKIKKHLTSDKKVYFVGMTNSGKSTLISKLIHDYQGKESQVTTSIYPSTTLGKIEIDFEDFQIIDTPGLLSDGSILNSISNEEIKKITPKKEIKPRSYQLHGKGALIIENYLRIDYSTSNNIVIYISEPLKITNVSEDNPRLKDCPKYHFKLSQRKDLVIEDLCFIKFTKSCQLDVYTSYKVNMSIRDNLI